MTFIFSMVDCGGDAFKKIGLGRTSLGHGRCTLEKRCGIWGPLIVFFFLVMKWTSLPASSTACCLVTCPKPWAQPITDYYLQNRELTYSVIMVSAFCMEQSQDSFRLSRRKHLTLLKIHLLLNVQ